MASRRNTTFARLLAEVRACTLCADVLEDGVRPVLQVDPAARILIAGQAPGRAVHASGVPFDDPSGDRLRAWTGLSRDTFYDPRQVAILPMGFCFPGSGKSADLAPRPECARAWRAALLAELAQVQLTLVIGRYALDWHLPRRAASLTEAVRAWRSYRPRIVPLPHPSPRNRLWLVKNPWFERDVLPYLKQRVRRVLA